MEWLKELLRRMRKLRLGEQFDADIDEELRLHRDMREKKYREAGMEPDEARYAAQRRIGNALRLREESRDALF
jgi:hypothetical protein